MFRSVRETFWQPNVILEVRWSTLISTSLLKCGVIHQRPPWTETQIMACDFVFALFFRHLSLHSEAQTEIISLNTRQTSCLGIKIFILVVGGRLSHILHWCKESSAAHLRGHGVGTRVGWQTFTGPLSCTTLSTQTKLIRFYSADCRHSRVGLG